MKNESNLKVTYDLFSAKTVEDIAVLSLNEQLLLRATDLEATGSLFDYFERISKSDVIKVVLIIGSPEKSGREEYIRFYSQLAQSGFPYGVVERFYNAVSQYILKLVDFNKLVVHADSGKVISLFMNASLACDYRIIGDNTVFQNVYLDLGLVPKGGGSFFLSRMLGFSKTFEILRRKEIAAEEALRFGIVDKVVPMVALNETALGIAKGFARQPARSLSGIKKLLRSCMKELEDCLECENRLLAQIVKTQDFRNSLLNHTESSL